MCFLLFSFSSPFYSRPDDQKCNKPNNNVNLCGNRAVKERKGENTGFILLSCCLGVSLLFFMFLIYFAGVVKGGKSTYFLFVYLDALEFSTEGGFF